MSGLDVEAFQRGDMAAISMVAATVVPEIWCIARRGFVCKDGAPTVVRGIDNPDPIEPLVIEIVGAVCTPAARPAIDGIDALRRAVRTRAKERLLNYAKRSGRMVTVKGDAAETAGLVDLDALIRNETELGAEDPPTDVEQTTRMEAELAITAKYRRSLDLRSANLIRLRWGEGKTALEVAKIFDCGQAAVRGWERLTRRELRHCLRAGGVHDRRRDASLDALLSGTPASSAIPPPTLQRICAEVCTRTFPREPAPFMQRAAWAIGAVAIATATWAMMYTGVLPYYANDKHPNPALVVKCKPNCTPGGAATVEVLAPRDARHVAVVMLDAEGNATPILTDPAGSSISLPFGARERLVAIPYDATLPATLTASPRAVAIFSTKELKDRSIREAGAGRGAHRASTIAVTVGN